MDLHPRVLVAIAATIGLLSGCSTPALRSAHPDPGQSSATKTGKPADGIVAEFRVKSDHKVHIMWGTTSGTSQADAKAGTWTKKVKLKTFDGATLIASNMAVTQSANITCEILINGVSKVRNSGSGQMAGASCTVSSLE